MPVLIGQDSASDANIVEKYVLFSDMLNVGVAVQRNRADPVVHARRHDEMSIVQMRRTRVYGLPSVESCTS